MRGSALPYARSFSLTDSVAAVRKSVSAVAARGAGAVVHAVKTVVGDGNLIEQEYSHGALVGRDAFGNLYYENRRYQSNRSRWVMYADTANYKANFVPPDWHAWLHHISDVAPSDPRAPSVYIHPPYEAPWDQVKLAEARPLSSYDPAVYVPPGYPKHPGGPRRYETVQRWQPPGGRGTP